ncbi:DNA (cytosine-5)-methyltransferase DRM2, partial [Selaginella moellendorffii]|uniref:DNA (cytosine-5)-methyltransferase DRM2 n=1 Tax=Selaginella moellendorffii TaxID=88036 RepID=UPI000D1CF25A
PDETLERHSRRLKGFGLPAETPIPRNLTSTQARKPYFYFENVRTMPNGSWDIISNSLYGIQPEFVCASHFSVSRRARGYIHNLPLENRQLILPIPPKTIREFLPATVQYTPAWDTRQQLNCINTCGNTASFCRNVQRLMAAGEPSEEAKKTIMSLVRRWNLVWTGPGTCSPLEAHEIEQALGYERGHTRGAITINERFKSLGNTFQVDVVGFHLSALRPLFPDGIRMLSLFSGIGGAEVALHRAGIKLKFVVSVESNVDNRRILERWWSTSGQTGQHRILDDVQDLTMAVVARLMEESGGFDLVIGGSPCNNLTGNNRSSRTGLGGEHSVLFFEFSRILNLVRSLTR